MISLHTVFVVTLVSQATSALILIILAGSDRRSRGLTALATACTLHTAAIGLMPLWRDANRWLPEAISAAFLVIIFALMHQGLRSLTGHHTPVSRLTFATVGALAVLVAGLAPWNQLWSMQIARLCTVLVTAGTARMLWRNVNPEGRTPARVTAGLLALVAVTFLLRLPLESAAPPSRFLLSLRELTMAEITLLAVSFLAVYLAETKRRLHSETRLDSLTGLLNRRALEETAAVQVRLAQRTGRPLCLLMLDLDSFKLLNDTWGHAVGDRALIGVGYVLLSAAKNSGNTVARLGGEEFAMLLPDHGSSDAAAIAEHLRKAVAALAVSEGSGEVHFTVSIGVASWHRGESNWTPMLRRADAALYRAKRDGRNQVAICEQAEVQEAEGRQGLNRRSARPRPAPVSVQAHAPASTGKLSEEEASVGSIVRSR